VQLFKRAAIKPPESLLKIRQEFDIKDPLFDKQWHVFNPLNRNRDTNLTAVWRHGVKGKGVVVGIVNDSIYMDSEDIKDQYCAPGSYEFNDYSAVPSQKTSEDAHGTRCAGENHR
jgi:kexin